MLSPRLQHLLANLKTHDLSRKRHVIDAKLDNHVQIEGRSLLNFCSNDYLHLTTHPAVKKAFIAGVQEHGLGSGASAQVSGCSKAHRLLEDAFAEFFQRERALLFNSGYHANLGVLTTFADRNSVILADKYCHASLIDGMLLSRAHHQRYRHNDLQHVQQLLKRVAQRESVLVTESIFSMQGDLADIPALATLATQHGALLIVDDAHGIGVLGQHGRGVSEHYQLSEQDLPCLITPFGKSVGSFGAVVSGRHDLIEALLQFSRTHRYSTALPPALCQATLMALTLIKKESWRREKLHALITFFNKEALARKLTIYSYDQTPIKLIRIGANKIALAQQKKLAEAGFFVSCIRAPTLPMNAASLRISLNCLHTEEQVVRLLDLLQQLSIDNTRSVSFLGV